MKIGLYLNYINTYTHTKGVWGDEIWALGLLKGLRNQYPGNEYFIFGENMGFMPEVDIAIYFHYPKRKLGREKNIYLQQNYKVEDNLNAKYLKLFTDLPAEKGVKIATISNMYAKKYGWKLLEPAVDLDVFYPVKYEQRYSFDVTFIGNNIKDEKKTQEYLEVPGIKYGIFGKGFNRSISQEDSMKLFISSYINLNFVVRPELDILIARPYQIASCKGFILSEWTESLEKNFGDSIEYIKPGQDPAVRIKEVLNDIKGNQSKAKEKRERAYKIVQEKFNAEIQAKALWEWINA